MFPTSRRLSFRNWTSADLDDFHEVTGDPEVMAHFPKTLSREETKEFIERLRQRYLSDGFTYFAVERKDTGKLIGFIGLAKQTYPASFTPCVDIGWRLNRAHWGQGFATEGARACLEFARDQLKLKEIYSIAVAQNLPSIHVMKKIGMVYDHHFFNDALKDYPAIETCALYRIALA